MNLNTTSVVPKRIPAILDLSRELNLRPMLWGPPGVGKTAMIEQYAQQIGGRLIDLRLTQIDNVDLRGQTIPDLASGKTRWLLPEILPEAGEKPGVIFLDEINRAEPRLQATCFSLLAEGRIGSWQVPDGWLICAAANGADHSDQIFEMDPALADRLTPHINVVPCLDSWIDWGQRTGESPEVMSFLQAQPDFFEGCEERIREENIVGYSPRGWSKVSKVLLKSQDEMMRSMMIPGIVGSKAASELFLTLEELAGHVSARKLLDMKRTERLQHIPRTLTGLYHLAYSLLGIAKNAKTPEMVVRAFEIVVQFHDIDARDDLPVQEIQCMAAEKIFEEAEHISGASEAILESPRYDEYLRNRPVQQIEALAA